jgi:hypothetical protein
VHGRPILAAGARKSGLDSRAQVFCLLFGNFLAAPEIARRTFMTKKVSLA